MAIIYAITKFRIYLIGRKFEIITDHKALTFLNKTQFLGARLCRWSLLLQEYDFSVVHCNGKDNTVADFFSRNPEGKYLAESPQQVMLSMLSWHNTETSSDCVSDALIMICRLEIEKSLLINLSKISD